MDQNGGRRGADTVFVAWDTTTPGLRRTLEGLDGWRDYRSFFFSSFFLGGGGTGSGLPVPVLGSAST